MLPSQLQPGLISRIACLPKMRSSLRIISGVISSKHVFVRSSPRLPLANFDIEISYHETSLMRPAEMAKFEIYFKNVGINFVRETLGRRGRERERDRKKRYTCNNWRKNQLGEERIILSM